MKDFQSYLWQDMNCTLNMVELKTHKVWPTIREGNGTRLQYSCLKNPMEEEPGRLHCMRLLRVGHAWATSLSLFTSMHWRRKWQPTPVFLPGESRGGLPSLGSHRVGHDWSNLAAAAWPTIFHWNFSEACGDEVACQNSQANICPEFKPMLPARPKDVASDMNCVLFYNSITYVTRRLRVALW